MTRIFNDVLGYIRWILSAYCDDKSLFCKWQKELDWFIQFDAERCSKYWNIAPELIDNMRWLHLGEVLNTCIIDELPVHEWEKRIVDVFLGKDEEAEMLFYNPPSSEESISYDGNNNEYPISYPYTDEHGVEWYNPYETMKDYLAYYEECEEERQEELNLAKQERAASRNDERRNRY